MDTGARTIKSPSAVWGLETYTLAGMYEQTCRIKRQKYAIL